jgi:IS605 OrfB family transposase
LLESATTLSMREAKNGNFHSWDFRKLQSFIKYEALERSISIAYVKPQNGS